MPRIYADRKWKLDRVSALSDGVIAIVITLLVLGLEVPSAQTEPEQELAGYLLQSLPAIVGYVVSFIIILMYWMQHYAIFHFVTRANRPFVLLNGVFLLFLTFLPFPTGLHAAYFDDTHGGHALRRRADSLWALAAPVVALCHPGTSAGVEKYTP